MVRQLTERISYAQVQRCMRELPDLVDVIRWLEPQIQRLQASGLNVRHDLMRENHVGLRWDRGN